MKYSDLKIIDLRVFNYVSKSIDIQASFLASQIIRNIIKNKKLITDTLNIKRDFIGDKEFFLIIKILASKKVERGNFDAYSRLPIDKKSLLIKMHKNYGLKVEFKKEINIFNATGFKKNYFSKNFKLKNLGYRPSRTSLQIFSEVVDEILIKR